MPGQDGRLSPWMGALFVAAAAGVAVAAGPAARADTARSAVPSAQGEQSARIVVGFKRRLSPQQVALLLTRDGAALRRRIAQLRAASATVPAADRDAILARLRANPDVRYADVDLRVGLARPIIGSRIRIARVSRAPNDDGFDRQYGLDNSSDHDIDATGAWDHLTECAKVAVLDTGVDLSHKDLSDNIWVNKGEVRDNGIDDDGNGYIDDWKGVDLIDGRGDGADDNGHGTHVAGIVAARGNNNRGVTGLCWKAKVIPMRFMDSGGNGYISDAAEGIVYAARLGAHVINASYSASTPSDVERDAIRYAAEQDTLIVAAAGNDDRNIDKQPAYPAAYPDDNILTVAATDDHDHLAKFSNYGKKAVDIAAPGDEIASTWDDGGYRGASGTSMAAPLVTAAAAMLRKEGVDSYKQIRKILLDTADDKKELKDKVASGGRLNVRRAVAAAD